MLWECEKGHKWKARLYDILINNWCPECSRFKKLDGLDIAKKIAKSHNGKCLTEQYENVEQKLLWECEKGHQWYAALQDIKGRMTWCSVCSGKKKLNIEIAKMEAIKRGGLCLSTIYVDGKTDLKWQCDKGHIWEAPLCAIKNRNTWCVYCNRGVVTFEDVKKIAEKRGGMCLSPNKNSYLEKLLWRCKKGHEWLAKAGDIKNGNWCPDCGRLNAAKTMNNSTVLNHWKTGEELICVGSYENKTVQFLNDNKIEFLWQPKSFIMPDSRSYRLDLYLSSENKWVEIKGFFRGDSKEKWDWFHKKYPNSELWNREKLISLGVL